VPTILGAAMLIYGLVATGGNVSVWLAGSDQRSLAENTIFVQTQRSLLTGLAALSILTGTGLCFGKNWAKSLAQTLTLATVLVVALFSLGDVVSGAANRSTKGQAALAALGSFIRTLAWKWDRGGVAFAVIPTVVWIVLDRQSPRTEVRSEDPSA
jgi:hypothetical protein